MKLSILNRHPRSELSAYLDGELIPLRIEAMQAHLASCTSCRSELEALRQLKAGLATLPEIAAPRSFALTPEMATRPLRERERSAVPSRGRALANGMRLAGAGMTLALVLVLVLDFTGSGTKGGGAPGAANVQQLGAAPNSDSSSSAGGIAPEPTPVPTHNDLTSTSVPAFPTVVPAPAEGGPPSVGPVTEIPPTPGPAQGSVGGAPSPAIVGTDGSPPTDKSLTGATQGSATSTSVPAAFPTVVPAPAEGGPPSVGPVTEIPPTPGPAQGSAGGAPSPAIVQTDGSPPTDRSLTGATQGSATNPPAAFNAQASASGAQQAAAASTGSGGGVDVLLVVALALAAGIVLAVAASFVLPCRGREDV